MHAKIAFALLCFWGGASWGQELRIEGGLRHHQVLQRDAAGKAEVTLQGTVSVPKKFKVKKLNGRAIEARVLTQGAVLPEWDWRPSGTLDKLAWTASVRNLPTGGPYRVEVRLAKTSSTAAVDDVLVGDLWILAGQSNMEGVGDLVDVQPPDPRVHSFDMADEWGVAQEPLHTLVSAADRVHWPRNQKGEYERVTGTYLATYKQGRKKGAGLGLPFAEEMVKRTGVPVGLVPCAHGGTSMEQWSPVFKDAEGDSLYGSMYRRFVAVGGHVHGVLWYQGESDANPKAAAQFLDRFTGFVKAMRADFGQPFLPFYYVQIGRHINDSNVAEWNRVQEEQLEAESIIPQSGMVASVDLSLDDGIHVSTPDLKRLGRRLALLAAHDLYPKQDGNAGLRRGPRPASARLNGPVLRVAFEGVNEGLQAEGRVSGFSIHDRSGKVLPLIFKMQVDPVDRSAVLLSLAGALPSDAVVWYGFGKDPYCNVRDGADLAVPVFGPMAISR